MQKALGSARNRGLFLDVLSLQKSESVPQSGTQSFFISIYFPIFGWENSAEGFLTMQDHLSFLH